MTDEEIERSQNNPAIEGGIFSDATMRIFAQQKPRDGEKYEDEPSYKKRIDKINVVPYVIPGDRRFAAHCPMEGGSTLVEPERQRFLYMDVGRWGGNGGEVDSEAHWAGDRYFGITCGEVAVLCRYLPPSVRKHPPKEPKYEPTHQRELDALQHDDYQRIRPLIDHLSSDASLGKVYVIKALSCTCPALPAPTSDRIYVHLGDLHAPIMDEPWKTLMPEVAKAQGREPYGSFAARMGRFALDDKDVESALKLIMRLADGAEPGKFNGLFGMASLAREVYIRHWDETRALLSDLSFLIHRILKKHACIEEWPDCRIYTQAEALRWFQLYHGTEGKKGADIFQDAGKDLATWIGLLESYQRGLSTMKKAKLASGEMESAKPIRLIQVGDLFDLWIGLGIPMHMTETPTTTAKLGAEFHGGGEMTVYLPDESVVNKLQEDRTYQTAKLLLGRERNLDKIQVRYSGVQQRFAEYWLDATLDSKCNGAGLRALLKAQKTALNAVFLAGNHDNYLAMGNAEIFIPDSNPPARLKVDSAFGREPGLFVEHGLRTDGFNDNYHFVVGWLLTQAAFVKPAVREMEPKLGGIVGELNNSYGERLTRIQGAIKACLDAKARMYVMGHTHRPFLTEVVIKHGEPCPTDDKDNYRHPQRAKPIEVVQGGQRFILHSETGGFQRVRPYSKGGRPPKKPRPRKK